MNPTVEAAFAAELLTLERVTDPPTGPLGYGTDLSCVSDCTDDFEEISGPMVVVQRIARRFITPRGTVLDDPDFGCDTRGLLNRGVPLDELRGMQLRMRNEALKEETVEDVAVTLAMNALASQVNATVLVKLKDANTNPFTFVLSVTEDGAVVKLVQGTA